MTKTAGGTLKAALTGTPEVNVGFIYGPDDRARLAETGARTLDLIYGHTLYGVHEDLGLPAETRYMCFLRHPITRTISHYYHLRNVEKGPVGDKIRKSRDINDFFASHQHWEFSNFMAKVISGLGPRPPAEGESAVRIAIDNIETRFDFVGFQEFFPLSIRAMSDQLGRPLTIETDVNRGRYAFSEVSEATIAKIDEINRADPQVVQVLPEQVFVGFLKGLGILFPWPRLHNRRSAKFSTPFLRPKVLYRLGFNQWSGKSKASKSSR